MIQSLEAEEYIAEIADDLDADSLLRAQRADENRKLQTRELQTHAHHLDSLEEREVASHIRIIFHSEIEERTKDKSTNDQLVIH